MHCCLRDRDEALADPFRETATNFIEPHVRCIRHQCQVISHLVRISPAQPCIFFSRIDHTAGNKYCLIASVHFNRAKVYIRHVLTHQAYDRGGWTT